MRNFLIATVLSIAASFAYAERTVGLHVASAHSEGHYYLNGKREAINDVNPGVYYRHDNGATVGVYYNSYRRTSAYVGWTFNVLSAGGFDVELTPVVLTGYDVFPGDNRLRFGVLPSVASPKFYGYRARVLGVPSVGNKSGFIHLMVERPF